MNIDFSFSIDDWMELFRRLFDLVINFFERLGIQLFPDEESTTAPESEESSSEI